MADDKLLGFAKVLTIETRFCGKYSSVLKKKTAMLEINIYICLEIKSPGRVMNHSCHKKRPKPR